MLDVEQIRGILESVVPSSLFASIRVVSRTADRFLSFPHFGCGYAALGASVLLCAAL